MIGDQSSSVPGERENETKLHTILRPEFNWNLRLAAGKGHKKLKTKNKNWKTTTQH